MLGSKVTFEQLSAHAQRIASVPLADLVGDAPRARGLVFAVDDLRVDLSRQRVTADILDTLMAFADDCNVLEKRAALFAGDAINLSEDRPVVHMAQRSAARVASDEFSRLRAFAEACRADPEIADVVNIGIGGSDLGPAMVSLALSGVKHATGGPRLHYVSNVDPSHLHDVLAACDPAHTQIIVTSKTFTTAETMRNAGLARDWLTVEGRLAGVTAAPKTAMAWGLAADRVFDFNEGVGGRYSLWSSVGLPVMIDVGSDAFVEMLQGAAAMDAHFETAPMAENLPIIMGLLRVWNRNFLGLPTLGIMPYDQRLARIPAWAQQLEMESNGKRVTRAGAPVDYATAPVIWGEAGTGCQHSFFQMLHQGTDIIPLDILLPLAPHNMVLPGAWAASHKILVANALAQAEALALGQENTAEPHRHFEGGRPSSVISWDRSTPFAIGRLLALYEHITVVSGFLWDVNSFDQWGVELGKVMAKRFEDVIETGIVPDDLSPTAADLLSRVIDGD